MDHLEVIRQALFALNGYRSPSLTRKQQRKELNRCYEILANVVYGPRKEGEEKDNSPQGSH